MAAVQSLFLVRSRLTIREYMRDGEDVREEIDLAWAQDAAEAEEKVKQHYEAQSDSYGTTYYCFVVSVKDAIS